MTACVRSPRCLQIIANYVKATGLEVIKYQDYSWDPVELNLEEEE